jgi:hypothetical protein
VRRVRFYEAVIDGDFLAKGAEYDELPELYIIYISRTDILKRGETVYHMEKRWEETGQIIDDGIHVIFVNAEIDDESGCADDPCDGKSQEYHVDCVVQGDNEQPPDRPQDTDAEKGDEGGNDGITHAAESTEKNLNRDVEKIKGHQKVHHVRSNRYYFWICAEEILQRIRKGIKNGYDSAQHDKHHERTFPDALHDPVPASCPYVLTDESCDGNAEGSHHHPENRVYFSVSCIGGDCIGSETVDHRHEDDIGESVHDLR